MRLCLINKKFQLDCEYSLSVGVTSGCHQSCHRIFRIDKIYLARWSDVSYVFSRCYCVRTFLRISRKQMEHQIAISDRCLRVCAYAHLELQALEM